MQVAEALGPVAAQQGESDRPEVDAVQRLGPWRRTGERRFVDAGAPAAVAVGPPTTQLVTAVDQDVQAGQPLVDELLDLRIDGAHSLGGVGVERPGLADEPEPASGTVTLGEEATGWPTGRSRRRRDAEAERFLGSMGRSAHSGSRASGRVIPRT